MPGDEATGQCQAPGGVRGVFAATALKVHLGVPRTKGLLTAIHAEGLGLERSTFQPHQALLEVGLLHIFRVLSPAGPLKTTAKPTESPAEPLHCAGDSKSPWALRHSHPAMVQHLREACIWPRSKAAALILSFLPFICPAQILLLTASYEVADGASNFASKQGAFPNSCASSFPAGTLQALGDAQHRCGPANKG